MFNLQIEQEKEHERYKRTIIIWIAVAIFLFFIAIGFFAYLRVQARYRQEFENLANASFEGIFIHDKGRIVHVNRKAEELVGISAAELKSKPFFKLVNPSFHFDFDDLWDTEKEENFQARINRADGEELEVEVLSKPFEYKKKKFRVAAVRDITRMARLTRDNIILWTAIEQMNDMILITDSHGHLIYVNQAFEKETGYTKGEILGKRSSFLKSGYHDFGFNKSMWYHLSSGRIWAGEILIRRKDGKLIWTRCIISPVNDEQGNLRYYVSVSENVTEQRKIALELQRKDKLYRQLASNLPGVAVFLINKDFVYELAEGLALHEMGLNSTDFENKSVLEFCISSPENKLEYLLEEVFRGKVITYQSAFHEKVYQITIIPLTEENEQINLVLLLMQDITEILQRENQLKENEAKLKKLLETKNRFISILAHDLRNPFASILGFSDLLYTEYQLFDDEQRLSFISNLRESSENTLKLLNSLISWSQIMDDRLEPPMERIQVGDLLSELLDVVGLMAHQKTIKLNFEFDSNSVLVSNWNMLSTVLRNLLTNAIKYSYTNSTVTLKVFPSSDGKGMDFQVIDTGVGIPKDALANLFEITKSLNTPGTAHEKGSGLGLLIVYEMIRKLGGEIFVDSSVGVGTVFTVRIPTRV
ncbi:MAG: PAS domain S-box protein [Bacteroidales bacterium]